MYGQPLNGRKNPNVPKTNRSADNEPSHTGDSVPRAVIGVELKEKMSYISDAKLNLEPLEKQDRPYVSKKAKAMRDAYAVRFDEISSQEPNSSLLDYDAADLWRQAPGVHDKKRRTRGTCETARDAHDYGSEGGRCEGQSSRVDFMVALVLQGAELRYPNAEKLTFALLIAMRKLRPYFQSQTIMVLTDKPLRQILHKPDLSARLVPWSIKLGEFDIQYKPCPSIKGQALSDFIVECTRPIEDEEPFLPDQAEAFTWTLFVDGSSIANKIGA
ncbi:hypothetical protein RJ639_032354 [Escallonia herrerae]|uniref:Reverse transcriptase RNase H-like domain-containing protein n=1 Tax=Escallonia herrerae TaxID=1293975 RepID=A0AA88WXV6_9ASTE|nr:hypothetical protein RJ639_032354 [Escallonia herrerae]